jgi:pimeloyl-ACP methyl ester carboxylesterase
MFRMNVHDVGDGPPLILVPGIQGRWEWMRPAVDALARRFRVVTFSLCDEPASGASFDAARGFDCYVDQVLAVMNTRDIARATICGVSYGGMIAAAFAARYPGRTSSLVLISAPPPAWRGNQRTAFYLRAPLLLSPLFALSSLRLFREMRLACGGWLPGIRLAIAHGWAVVTHPGSPGRMARRIQLLERLDLASKVVRLKTETLIITGEDGLDGVVPPEDTREYLRIWPHARSAVVARTGHLAVVTRPDEITRLIGDFAPRSVLSHDDERRFIV